MSPGRVSLFLICVSLLAPSLVAGAGKERFFLGHATNRDKVQVGVHSSSDGVAQLIFGFRSRCTKDGRAIKGHHSATSLRSIRVDGASRFERVSEQRYGSTLTVRAVAHGTVSSTGARGVVRQRSRREKRSGSVIKCRSGRMVFRLHRVPRSQYQDAVKEQGLK